MIKMTYCLRRQPHLTREQFQDYWLNSHGKLVQQHAQALNVRRYVQVHTADLPLNGAMRKSRGSPEAFDGVAELWFDSVEALLAPNGTPEGKAAARALREDEERFIDQANSPVWLSEEHTLVQG
jgi:uncharacterized protein (TIGR02118 family)